MENEIKDEVENQSVSEEMSDIEAPYQDKTKQSQDTMKALQATVIKYFLIVKQALYDLLDLKGIEDKLPESIQEKLPENRRLVTLPFFIGFMGFLLIFLLAVFAPTAEKKGKEKFVPIVRVVTATKEDIRIPVFSQGVVKPARELQIISLVGGPVEYVSPNFVDGGSVEKDELLLQISDRSYQQDKARAEANLARANSAQVAKRSELRVRGTLRTDAGKAQLRDVNASVKAAEADVERVNDLIESTKFKAPFSGLIRQANIQKGQLISAGTPMASIFSSEKFVMNLPLSDRQLSLVSLPDMNVKRNEKSDSIGYIDDSSVNAGKIAQKNYLSPVKISAEFGDRNFYWHGKLVRSAGGRNTLNRLQYVIVEIDDPYAIDLNQIGRPPLSPGFFVHAEIEGREYKDIIKLPRKALKSNQKVWGVSAEGNLKSFDVKLLHRGQDYIYVLSGLEDGVPVVVSDLEVFANGVEVKPVPIEAKTEAQAEPKVYDEKEPKGDINEAEDSPLPASEVEINNSVVEPSSESPSGSSIKPNSAKEDQQSTETVK